MEKLVSKGKCFFCDKKFSQRGITKHLQTHLNQEITNYKNKKQGLSFLVKVQAQEMFLMLWVDGKTTYDEVDQFLRQIWLECCGHMSSFTDPSQKRNSLQPSLQNIFSMDEMNYPGEIDMNTPIYKTYSKNKKLQYDYDFGTTTRLDFVLIDQIDIPAPSHILLLSRNEPLKIMCHKCGDKPAVEICTVHWGYDASFFCKKCAKAHEKECEDFADYAAMSVVNSPRMGECGYEGGEIDLERDGVYKG